MLHRAGLSAVIDRRYSAVIDRRYSAVIDRRYSKEHP